MDDGGTGMRVERPHSQLPNFPKLCMPVRPLHVMKGVYWGLVVVQRLEQVGGMKGVYWALVRLQSKGRPPVRQWRGATTAGGVPKEGLLLLLLQGVQGLGLWLRAGLHLGLLSPIGRSVSHLSVLVTSPIVFLRRRYKDGVPVARHTPDPRLRNRRCKDGGSVLRRKTSS